MKDTPMNAVCDSVVERVALGEPLGELSEHVAGCTRCQQVVALTTKLGGTHTPVDPGLGFAARMTAGAQHRLGVRRRQRLTATLAGTVAVGALGVFLVTRSPATTEPSHQPAIARPEPEPEPSLEQPLEDEALESLLHLAKGARHPYESAPWGRIQKPLVPYVKLVKGVAP